MDDLKFAVFGAGFWASFQIPAWFEVGGVQLVALYNRTVSKAEKMAARFNVPRVYSDPEELFQKEDLDFVDIVTEVPAHAPLVFLAAKYKVPVICQKPMGPDYETCRQMVQACKEAGIPFFIHDNFRWIRPIRQVKRMLEEGRIGKPYRARFQFWHGTPEHLENQPFLKTLTHWMLTDMGSHAFDLARFLFGEAQSLYCQHYRTGIVPDALGEDVASVMLWMGELICHVDLGYVHDPILSIEGTEGILEWRTDHTVTVSTEEGAITQRYPPPKYAWADPEYGASHPATKECNAHLLNALKTGQPAETSGEEYLKTMRLVYAAYESAERNQVIELELSRS